MSYTPTVWQDNDTITAAKLNKIENEIANQYFDTNIFTGFPTWNQVKNLLDKGIIPIIIQQFLSVNSEESGLKIVDNTPTPIPSSSELNVIYIIQYNNNKGYYYGSIDEEWECNTPNSSPIILDSTKPFDSGIVIVNDGEKSSKEGDITK